MTNGDRPTYCTTRHANDLTLCTINDQYYMYIVTMKTGSYSLVKLRYSGATYYKVGNYTIKYNGANKSMSGLSGCYTDTNVNFIFKSGKTFYRGSLGKPRAADNNVTYAFTVMWSTRWSTAKGVRDRNLFNPGHRLPQQQNLLPADKEQCQHSAVYDNISSASGTIYAMNDLSLHNLIAYPVLLKSSRSAFGQQAQVCHQPQKDLGRHRLGRSTLFQRIHTLTGLT